MSLNPLDLRGPEFLALYSGLLIAAAFGLRAVRKFSESKSSVLESLAEDPYKIALLRGDSLELVLVSVLSLTERGLVETHDNKLFLKDPEASAKVRRPLDKAILSKLEFAGGKKDRDLSKGRSLEDLHKDGIVRAEYEAIESLLRVEGHLPDADCFRNRYWLAFCVTALLWALGGSKLFVALERGHHNVGLLILLLTVTPLVMLSLIRSRRTEAGDLALRKTEDWYARLRDTSSSLRLGDSSGEFTYLAAVYGFSLLPLTMSSQLPPRPKPVGFVSQTGDSGGSSSCSSGSSSCGGGGGCGGCGGGGD